jgi:hypothetical protein
MPPRNNGKNKKRKSREFVAAAAAATGSGSATLEQLQDQLQYIEDNFSALAKACTTEAQMAELRRDYLTAHRNFTNALGAIIDDNNQHVRDLNQKMAAGQQEIQGLAISEASVSRILGALTAAVQTASSLLALVGA